MHPFYDASRRLVRDPDDRLLGLVSMAAYLAFWAAAIPVALRVLSRLVAPRALLPTTGGPTAPDRAEAILRERYAAGDIDDAELQHRLEALRHHGGTP